jgi:hypothetical protein
LALSFPRLRFTPRVGGSSALFSLGII